MFHSDNWFGLVMVVFAVLFIGDPDLHDALMQRLSAAPGACP